VSRIVLGPRQCDGNRVRIQASGGLRYPENKADDLRVYVNSLDECPDYLSSAMPVSARQVWPNGYRQLAQAFRCQAEIFQMTDIARVSFYSSI